VSDVKLLRRQGLTDLPGRLVSSDTCDKLLEAGSVSVIW
jgi:hypothetical protein